MEIHVKNILFQSLIFPNLYVINYDFIIYTVISVLFISQLQTQYSN